MSRSLFFVGLFLRSCISGSGVEDVEIDEDFLLKYVFFGFFLLEIIIENLDERSDGEMFDKDSVEVVERCFSLDSVDSISYEISYFRLIRVCFLISFRKFVSGKIVEIFLIRIILRNLNKIEFGFFVRILLDIDVFSLIM